MSYLQLYNPNVTFHGGVVPYSVPPPPPMFDKGVMVGVTPYRRSRPGLPRLCEVRAHMSRVLRAVDSLRQESHSLLVRCGSAPPEEWERALRRLHTQRSHLQRQLSTFTDTYVEGVQCALRKRASRRTRHKRLKREVQGQRENEKRREEELEVHLNQERRKKEEELVNKQQKVERCEVSVSRRWCERLKLVRVLTRARSLNRTPHLTYNNTHLDKLIFLWSCKVQGFEGGEGEETGGVGGDKGEEGLPHRDLTDIQHFLTNRASWDVYVSEGGSAPPPGWVSPPPDDVTRGARTPQ